MKDNEAQWRWCKFQINATREFTANLISWKQILDFEFHLSRCLPLTLYTVMIFFAVNFRSLYIYIRVLLVPYPAYISLHEAARLWIFLDLAPSQPSGYLLLPDLSPSKLYIPLWEYHRYISRTSRRISKIFLREKWRFGSRGEILGPLLYK